jgi:hypothetical protein
VFNLQTIAGYSPIEDCAYGCGMAPNTLRKALVGAPVQVSVLKLGGMEVVLVNTAELDRWLRGRMTPQPHDAAARQPKGGAK